MQSPGAKTFKYTDVTWASWRLKYPATLVIIHVLWINPKGYALNRAEQHARKHDKFEDDT